MKTISMKAIFIIFILIFQSNFAQNIVTEVTYKQHATEKTTHNKKLYENPNQAAAMIIKSYELVKELNYSLTFNNTKSLFKQLPSMNSDSDGQGAMAMMARVLSKTYSGGNYIFFIDLKTQKILRKSESGGKTYIIASPLNKFKWKTSKETKKIGDYTCYKATTITRIKSISSVRFVTTTAWYAPIIPASFGPLGFGGLPGLILELDRGGFVFVAKKINFKKNEKNKIELPKGDTVTAKEFENIEKSNFGSFLILNKKSK